MLTNIPTGVYPHSPLKMFLNFDGFLFSKPGNFQKYPTAVHSKSTYYKSFLKYAGNFQSQYKSVKNQK